VADSLLFPLQRAPYALQSEPFASRKPLIWWQYWHHQGCQPPPEPNWVCPKNLDGQEIEPRQLPKLKVLRKKLLISLVLSVCQSLRKLLLIELQHHIVTCIVETFSTSHADKVCMQMLDDLTSHLAPGVKVVLIEMVSLHFFVLGPK
jgi:hypothetical protein